MIASIMSTKEKMPRTIAEIMWNIIAEMRKQQVIYSDWTAKKKEEEET